RCWMVSLFPYSTLFRSAGRQRCPRVADRGLLSAAASWSVREDDAVGAAFRGQPRLVADAGPRRRDRRRGEEPARPKHAGDGEFQIGRDTSELQSHLNLV